MVKSSTIRNVPKLQRWTAARVARVIVGGLLSLSGAIACGTGEAAEPTNPPELGECAGAPTARCVIDLAIEAAGATVDAHDRAAAFARIAEAQVEAGESEAARQSLSRALTDAAAIHESAFGREAVIMGLPEDEAGLARVEVLSDVSRVLATLGEEERAKATFLRATATAEAIESNRHRVQGLVKIATDQLAVGALMDARATFARADLANDAQYVPGLHRIVRIQAETGDVEGALATAEPIGVSEERARALADIARVQAGTGDAAGALDTARRVEDPYFGMVAMHYIGTALAEAGDILAAWNAVRAIGDIWRRDKEGRTGSRDRTILQEDTVGAIVAAHIAAGEIKAALDAAEDMTDALAFVEAHAAIARAQTAAGELDAARASADKVCAAHPRYADRCVELLAVLAVARAEAGHDERAKAGLSMAQAVAEDIIYHHERARAFVALHAARRQMGDIEGSQRAFIVAVNAAEALRYARERAEHLSEMAAEATRRGDGVSAARALAAALTAAAGIADADGRVRTLVRTGLTQLQAGDVSRARDAFSRAVSAATAPESVGRRAALLADIAFALESGQLPAPNESFGN